MTRNLKALGLALVAVFAMSAVAASAASAQEGMITVEGGGTVNLNALSSAHKFTSPAGTIECTESEFNATAVANNSKSVTITPRYGGVCTAAGQSATVDVNGCDFTLDDATTVKGNSDYQATVDISCPAGKPGIVVTAFAGTGHAFKVCEITVPPQNGIKPVTVSNNANETITLSGTATGVSYSKSGLCGTESNKAEYDLGTTAVTGSTGFTISD